MRYGDAGDESGIAHTKGTGVPSKNSIRGSGKERCLTNDGYREQSGKVMRTNNRSFELRYAASPPRAGDRARGTFSDIKQRGL